MEMPRVANKISISQRSAARIVCSAPGAPYCKSSFPSCPRCQGRAERRAFGLPAASCGGFVKTTRASVTTESRIASAFRARCLRLAPCSPPVETGLLSTAGARTDFQAGCHGLGLRSPRHVAREKTATAPRPTRRDDREASLGEGRDGRDCGRGRWQNYEYNPSRHRPYLTAAAAVTRPRKEKARRGGRAFLFPD